MALDLAALDAKLKELEARLPGFAAVVSAALKNTQQNALLNSLLAKVNPNVAATEQNVLITLEHYVDFTAAGAAQLLPYLEGLIELFMALQPKPVAA